MAVPDHLEIVQDDLREREKLSRALGIGQSRELDEFLDQRVLPEQGDAAVCRWASGVRGDDEVRKRFYAGAGFQAANAAAGDAGDVDEREDDENEMKHEISPFSCEMLQG